MEANAACFASTAGTSRALVAVDCYSSEVQLLGLLLSSFLGQLVFPSEAVVNSCWVGSLGRGNFRRGLRGFIRAKVCVDHTLDGGRRIRGEGESLNSLSHPSSDRGARAAPLSFSKEIQKEEACAGQLWVARVE